MANDKKVEQITDMEVDFAQWFTDVCRKAELIDYSSIKGVFTYPEGAGKILHRPTGRHKRPPCLLYRILN